MARFENIVVESANGVKILTLNRPDIRNALNRALVTELVEALQEARTCSCGVLILTGAGSAFCAGMDMEPVRSMTVRTPAENRDDSELLAHALRTLYDFPKPVIAAVNGPAIAGGMSLATIPDFTLATPESKFGFNEVRVGLVPAIAASFLLRQVGGKRARDLLLTGRLLKAPEALGLGLVTEIVPAEELMKSACALAQTLLMNSPQAMRAVKALLSKHNARQLDEELEEAISANANQRSADDFKEGVHAFLQRRRANWPSAREKISA